MFNYYCSSCSRRNSRMDTFENYVHNIYKCVLFDPVEINSFKTNNRVFEYNSIVNELNPLHVSPSTVILCVPCTIITTVKRTGVRQQNTKNSPGYNTLVVSNKSRVFLQNNCKKEESSLGIVSREKNSKTRMD